MLGTELTVPWGSTPAVQKISLWCKKTSKCVRCQINSFFRLEETARGGDQMPFCTWFTLLYRVQRAPRLFVFGIYCKNLLVVLKPNGHLESKYQRSFLKFVLFFPSVQKYTQASGVYVSGSQPFWVKYHLKAWFVKEVNLALSPCSPPFLIYIIVIFLIDFCHVFFFFLPLICVFVIFWTVFFTFDSSS